MSPTLADTAQPRREMVTMADVLERIGDIPAKRVRLHPAPGTATIPDLSANRHCELIEGILVEKAMGFKESMLALSLGALLRVFVVSRNLGVVLAPDGPLEILTNLVRMPDVAYLSWDRLPDRRIPDDAVPAVAPDLAVEVLSESNTPAEMARKRGEYFRAGVKLVWIVDHFTRTVTVYTAEDQYRVLRESDTLDGGEVLPGFLVSLKELFGELDRRG